MSRALESLRPSSTARVPLPNAAGRIERWLRSKIGRALISVEPRAAADGGFSGELYFIEVRSEGALGAQEYVLRRRGGPDVLFPDADFSIQHRILRALRGSRDVPVPEIVWVEEDERHLDAPFFVMERIHGDVLAHFGGGAWLAEATVQQRRRMWESGIRVLARIHGFDWKAAGLDLRRGASEGRSELAADISYWRDLYERGSDHAFRELLDAGFGWLCASMPREERLCLCWGDARHQNMIFRNFECAAVLDWEMATLGSPEKDVAFLLSVDRNLAEAGLTRLDGLLTERETIALYEAESGRPLANMEYYGAFAIVRALVMQARFMKLGLMPSDPVALRDNISARQLWRFLAERIERVPAPA